MKKVALAVVLTLALVQVASAVPISFNVLPTNVTQPAPLWYGYNDRAVEWDFLNNSALMAENVSTPTGAPGAKYDNTLGTTNTQFYSVDTMSVGPNALWNNASTSVHVGGAIGNQGTVVFHLGDSTNLRAVWVELVVESNYNLQVLVGNSNTQANPLNVRVLAPDIQYDFAHGAATGSYTSWASKTGDVYTIDFWMAVDPTVNPVDIQVGMNNSGDYYMDIRSVKILTSAVPEPATMALFGSALVGLGAWVRKRRRS